MNVKNKYPDWFKPKYYLHLMPRIKHSDYLWVKKIVTNPEKVASHNFYPLIHRAIKTRRYKKLNYQNCELQQYRSHFDIDKFEPTTKVRDIHFPNHLDGLIYSFYAVEELKPKYELALNSIKGLQECITAYRRIETSKGSKKGKSNIHFANDVFQHIRKVENCVAIAFDIKNFFSSLDHSYLKETWSELLGNKRGEKLPCDHYKIFKSITNYHYVEEEDLLSELNLKKYGKGKNLRKATEEINSYCTNEKEFRQRICGKNNKKGISLLKKGNPKGKGIPQGTAISAILANIYLLELDKEIYNVVTEMEGGFYRRYSDDIVIICPVEKEFELKSLLQNKMKSIVKLAINSEKTEVVYFKNGQLEDKKKPFRYLGFEFNGKDILLRSSTLSKYYRRMKNFVKRKIHVTKIMSKYEQEDTKVWTRQILKKYTSSGSRNFISYAQKAEEIVGEGAIENQIKAHKKKTIEYIKKRTRQRTIGIKS